MIRINLLPWREERKRRKIKQFYTALVYAVVCVAVAFLGVHWMMGQKLQMQHAVNSLYEKEIAGLNNKIKEIKDIEDEKSRLLLRMEKIQELSKKRPNAIHLMETLVDAVPDGVYLTDVRQNGTLISIRGMAQSNGRISEYLRNLEAGKYLASPRLDRIDQKLDHGVRVSRFSLKATQVAPKKNNKENDG